MPEYQSFSTPAHQNQNRNLDHARIDRFDTRPVAAEGDLGVGQSAWSPALAPRTHYVSFRGDTRRHGLERGQEPGDGAGAGGVEQPACVGFRIRRPDGDTYSDREWETVEAAANAWAAQERRALRELREAQQGLQQVCFDIAAKVGMANHVGGRVVKPDAWGEAGDKDLVDQIERELGGRGGQHEHGHGRLQHSRHATATAAANANAANGSDTEMEMATPKKVRRGKERKEAKEGKGGRHQRRVAVAAPSSPTAAVKKAARRPQAQPVSWDAI